MDEKFYHTLLFPKDIISINYTDGHFHHFTFNYISTSTGYILEGFAYDVNNHRLRTKITLSQLSGTHPRKLKNLKRGHLNLTKEVMEANEMDGTVDCELVPKKYHEDEKGEMDYVSYRVKGHHHQLIFQEFDLDPSPPAD